MADEVITCVQLAQRVNSITKHTCPKQKTGMRCIHFSKNIIYLNKNSNEKDMLLLWELYNLITTGVSTFDEAPKFTRQKISELIAFYGASEFHICPNFKRQIIYLSKK